MDIFCIVVGGVVFVGVVILFLGMIFHKFWIHYLLKKNIIEKLDHIPINKTEAITVYARFNKGGNVVSYSFEEPKSP